MGRNKIYVEHWLSVIGSDDVRVQVSWKPMSSSYLALSPHLEHVGVKCKLACSFERINLPTEMFRTVSFLTEDIELDQNSEN